MCSVGKVEQSRSQEPGANDSSTAVVQQRRVRRILQTPLSSSLKVNILKPSPNVVLLLPLITLSIYQCEMLDSTVTRLPSTILS